MRIEAGWVGEGAWMFVLVFGTRFAFDTTFFYVLLGVFLFEPL